jgi:hypothetical protein
VAVSVTDTVRALIDAGVRSLEQLEILLVLSQDPGKAWPLEAVHRSTMLTPERADTLVAGLVRADLVTRDGEVLLRLGPRVDVPALKALRAAYERDRSNVVNAFFASNLDSLRSFANAFKLRRND